MEYYITVNDDGDIGCISNAYVAMDDYKTIQVDIEDDINYERLSGYKYADGQIIFDENKYSKFIIEQEHFNAINECKEVQNKLIARSVMQMATDDEAYSMRYLYPTWESNSINYNKDERLMYNDKFYKVLSNHTSQESWTPDVSSSLFVEIANPSVEYPEWKQPISAETSYMSGDKVTFKGKKYISLMDYNAYSPEAYPQGWKEI